jgi:hypothetical protein
VGPRESTRLAWFFFLFLYCVVLEAEPGSTASSARRAATTPCLLTRDEVRSVLEDLDGVPRLMAYLLYGARLRLLEFAACEFRASISARIRSSTRDRVTMSPAVIKADLARHLDRVREPHQHDVESGAGWVKLPTALARIPERRPGVDVALGASCHPHLRGAGHGPASTALTRGNRASGRPAFPSGQQEHIGD